MGQIVIPAAARSVITPVAQTTFQVGTYAPLNDTFTKTLDLNDHVSYWLVKVDLPQPEKVYARTSTIRAAGERITNWNYKNRHITVTLQLLYQSGTTALLQAVRALLAAIENPPYRLAFAPPNASVLTYADVVAVKHTIPSDAKVILAKAISNITIDFECAPGFSGDRITLQNLVVNPGFEAPSGPGVGVFSDSFTNTNAYTTVSGSPAAVSANVMFVAANTTVTFGSPSWGAINTWQARFQYAASGASYYFALHYTDANNQLRVDINATSQYIDHYVAGTAHTVASSALTMSVLSWYWLKITQFPSAPGTAPNVLVYILSDSSGAPGTVLATLGPVATYDAVTALSGKMALITGSQQLPIGGAFAGVNQVSLFGPGAWSYTESNSATGITSGAWDQNTANTYSGGAVTSYGAARHDLPPAGTASAFWETFSGGTPTGSNAIPASTGQVMAASVYARSSGLSGTATLQLQVREWDVNGNFLRSTTLQSVTGNQASWVKLSGTATMGASTVFCSVLVSVADMAAGASANGTVWWDNAQCWNQTTTGQTVMPYCELRFPQSPAQLLLTGLQGDLAAPAALSMGAYFSSTPGGNIYYWLGQRATPQRGGRLIPLKSGAIDTPTLDSASYGGWYGASPSSHSATINYGTFGALNTLAGIFHVLTRVKTSNTSYSAQTVYYQVFEQTQAQSTSSAVSNTQYLSNVTSAGQPAGLSSTTNWGVADAGALTLPLTPLLSTQDASALYTMLQYGVQGTSAGVWQENWGALLPVDGGVVLAVANVALPPLTAPWLWLYSDGQNSTYNQQPSLRFSTESTPTPNPNNAGSGVNSTSTSMTLTTLADAYLTLDPTQTDATTGLAIAQALGVCSDNTGTVYPFYGEVSYTPLYLYPRQS